MNKRNLVFAMMLSSLLGAVIALGGYSLFVKEDPNKAVPTAQTSSASFTNYVFDTTDYVVPEGLNFVYAARAATPAVVHIRTVYDRSQVSESDRQVPMEEFFRDFFDQNPRSDRRPSRGAGSGVIISEEGHIVTNFHVVEDAKEIEVQLNDNRTYRAEVVGTDPSTDIAVLQIDSDKLQVMEWGNSDAVNIGEWVLAVGNPFDFRSTVTAGIVSAKARNINILAQNFRGSQNLAIESFIQTDAAVNPGNSGGALVNLKGELIGINTAIISPTGAFAGYSFAVPVSLVQKVVEDIIEFGEVKRALLGIQIRDVSSQLVEEEKLSVIRGVYISSVNLESAAEEAGLKSGDVIVEIDGKPVNNVAQLQEQVALKRPGEKVNVTFVRDGDRKNVRATLKGTETLEMPARRFEIEGAVFQELTDEEKEEFEVDGGVKVTGLGNGKWSDAGIREGFIITRIDKKNIETLDEFRAYINAARGEGLLIEGMYPDGDKAYYGIGW